MVEPWASNCGKRPPAASSARAGLADTRLRDRNVDAALGDSARAAQRSQPRDVMVPSHPAIPPRRRRKEERPGEILAAALSLFAERGFAATRLDDVAARAGASKGTIYLYYSTKEALFEAVVRDAISPVLDRVAGAIALPDVNCAALLSLMIETMYREVVGTERREILRLLVAEAQRFPDLVSFYHREAISRGKALLAEILERGIAIGEFRDCPAARYPEVIIAPAIMAAVWKLVFDPVEPMDLDTMIEAHLDLILGALKPQAAKQVAGKT